MQKGTEFVATKVKPAYRLALGKQIKAQFSDGKWHPFERRMLRRLAQLVMRRLPLRQSGMSEEYVNEEENHLAKGGKQ